MTLADLQAPDIHPDSVAGTLLADQTGPDDQRRYVGQPPSLGDHAPPGAQATNVAEGTKPGVHVEAGIHITSDPGPEPLWRTMSEPTSAQLSALALANKRRADLTALRRALLAKEDTAAAVLRRRDPRVSHLAIIDVVRLGRNKPHHVGDKIRTLGAAAVRDGINLLNSVGDASGRSLEWTASYLDDHPATGGRGLLRKRETA